MAADLTDEGGETRSAERAVRLGFTSIEAQLDDVRPALKPNEPMTVTVRRTNLDGVPRAGTGSYRQLALTAPSHAALPADLPRAPAEADSASATPGDHQRARWETTFDPGAVMANWPDGAEKAHGALTHDAAGKAQLALPGLPPGAYRLRYATADEHGQPAEAQRDFVVVGSAPLPLAAALWLDSPSVRAGETLRMTAFTGLAGQTLFLDIYQDGRLRERRTVDASRGGTSGIIELPITAKDRGGLSFRLWGARDHQWLNFAESVTVPWDDKELTVRLSTFRDKIRPGAKEVWRVHVSSGSDGKSSLRAAAEVLAYMYDRSLDLFATHTPPRPIDLFPSRNSSPWLQLEAGSNRAYALLDTRLPSYAPDWLRGDTLNALADEYGIGGPGVRRRMAMLRAQGAASAGDMRNEAVDAPAPPPAPQPITRGKDEEGKMGHAAASTPTEDPAPAHHAGATPSSAPPGAVRSNFSEERALFSPQH